MKHDETVVIDWSGGMGCLFWIVAPLFLSLCAFAAHCGWSAYHP